MCDVALMWVPLTLISFLICNTNSPLFSLKTQVVAENSKENSIENGRGEGGAEEWKGKRSSLVVRKEASEEEEEEGGEEMEKSGDIAAERMV